MQGPLGKRHAVGMTVAAMTAAVQAREKIVDGFMAGAPM